MGLIEQHKKDGAQGPPMVAEMRALYHTADPPATTANLGSWGFSIWNIRADRPTLPDPLCDSGASGKA